MSVESVDKWQAAKSAFLGYQKPIGNDLVPCPEKADGILNVYDEIDPDDSEVTRRFMVCPTCGARYVAAIEGTPKARSPLFELYRELHWSDLSPAERAKAGRVFDIDVARRTIEDAARDFMTSQSRPWDTIVPLDVHSAVDRALISEFGAWISGWHWWGDDEGSGPFELNDHYLQSTTPAAYADGVLKGIADLHKLLGTLDVIFLKCKPKDTDAAPAQPTVAEIERAAAELTNCIASYSVYGMWYYNFALVLGWYFESFGVDIAPIREDIVQAVRGTFRSWTTEPRDCSAAGVS